MSRPCKSLVRGGRCALRRGRVVFADEPALLHDLVEPRQRLLERLRLVGDLELEERLLLDELARALRILDARDLDDDAIVALLLHDRLGDAEPFDARAHRLQRAIDRFGLLVGGMRLLRVVDLEREIRPALEVEALAAAERCDGHVVQQCRPAARSRRVTLRGNRNQTDTRQRPMMVRRDTSGAYDCGWKEVEPSQEPITLTGS